MPRQKIRFMWFGGEEEGLVGSQYYAEHLTTDRGEQDHGHARHRHDLLAELRPVSSTTATARSRATPPAHRVRVRSSGCSPTSGAPRALLGADPVRRALGLRRVHQPRHPRRRHLRRRRGAEDRGSRWRSTAARRTSSRPVLPRFLRPAVEHPRGTSAGGALRPARSSDEAGGQRRRSMQPVPAGDDPHHLVLRQGEEPAAATDGIDGDHPEGAVQVPRPSAGASALS